MNDSVTCPACGSSDIATSRLDASLPVPMAEPVIYSERVDLCGACGTEGDFARENDATVEAALAAAGKRSARAIIESLAADGISMAYFERAFGLPQRTMARWKAGECSAGSLALLRVVRSYPWVLRVAERSFSERVARKELVRASASSGVRAGSR